MYNVVLMRKTLADGLKQKNEHFYDIKVELSCCIIYSRCIISSINLRFKAVETLSKRMKQKCILHLILILLDFHDHLLNPVSKCKPGLYHETVNHFLSFIIQIRQR